MKIVWRSEKMADPANPGGNGAGDDKELPKEDNIRVVCRFRPLNDTEERTGSKFVVKFPDDQCASITVIFWTKISRLFEFL